MQLLRSVGAFALSDWSPYENLLLGQSIGLAKNGDCFVAREGYVEGLGIEGPVGLSRREEFLEVVADRIGKLDGGIRGQQLGQAEHIIAMLFDVFAVDFFRLLTREQPNRGRLWP